MYYPTIDTVHHLRYHSQYLICWGLTEVYMTDLACIKDFLTSFSRDVDRPVWLACPTHWYVHHTIKIALG